MSGDSVTVSVLVDVEPEVAFDVFTQEIDQWWRRAVGYRVAGRKPGTLVLECKLGGRVFEQHEGVVLHESGRITAWEPPSHLAFEWRAANFRPGDVTYVDITFTRTESGRTQLVLVHRGFAALPADHPVRHGQPADKLTRAMGLWWGHLLSSLREHARSR
jgi:uncharacterized protein YndB with AHSA1/START domain